MEEECLHQKWRNSLTMVGGELWEKNIKKITILTPSILVVIYLYGQRIGLSNVDWVISFIINFFKILFLSHII